MMKNNRGQLVLAIKFVVKVYPWNYNTTVAKDSRKTYTVTEYFHFMVVTFLVSWKKRKTL